MAGSYAVSRVGPSSTRAPSSLPDSNPIGPSVAIIVVAATASALLCLGIVMLVLRRNQRRRRQISLVSDTSTASRLGEYHDPELTHIILWIKNVEGQEEGKACNEGAGTEEQLVVMAGQDVPSFLAHPATRAPSPTACKVQIQCPPLHL